MTDTPIEGPKRVSKRLRFEVFNRDNHTCRYCGRSAPEVELTVDHVVPKVLGGTNRPENLVTACRDCNSGKSSSHPDAERVAEVAEDAVRWAAAMQEAGRRWREGQVGARNAFADAWNAREGGKVPTTWGQSIDTMVGAGLTAEDFPIIVGVAFTKDYVDDRWAWFCGVAWRIARERQESARELVGAGDAAEQSRAGAVDWGMVGYGAAGAALSVGVCRSAASAILSGGVGLDQSAAQVAQATDGFNDGWHDLFSEEQGGDQCERWGDGPAEQWMAGFQSDYWLVLAEDTP